MKDYFLRLMRLLFGLFLFALGVVFTIKGNIGYAPWEVFHVGISKTTGISIGTATILVGIIIVFVTVLLGEKLGIGTILNMLLIGTFLDLILESNLIPIAINFWVGIIMLILGLFIISLASYFYMGSSFGAGPRDSLMVALARKTGLPIGLCRGIIEVFVVFLGWILGGMAGIGTIISAFSIGFCVQITFKLLKFDTTEIKHETLKQTYNAIFNN
ncbi:YczE/YyaS/YitT family protein [Clostridium sp. DL1XJH146]